MRDPTCTPTPSEPEAKIHVQCLPECSSFRNQRCGQHTPSGCFLALRNRAGGGRWRGEQQGPPQANQGAAQGARCWGSAPWDRECAEPDTTLPPSPRAAGPHVPSVPSLRDLPGTQSHCFPPPWTPVCLRTLLAGARCSSPASCPRETHRAPVSRGHPISRQACVLKLHLPFRAHARTQGSGSLLFLLSFYKEEVGFPLRTP